MRNLLELQTPCYILDEKQFVENIKDFYNKLRELFEDVIVAYSFKTNSLPRLLYLALENNCFAEVVSDDEYLLAERIGFSLDRIIFNGPVKQKEIFIRAINGNSYVNIDSEREVGWLTEIAIGKKVNIGIRVNFDLEKLLPGQSSTGANGGRFGFCYENGELHKVINKIKENKNINITRLHMHVSNKSKSEEVYQNIAEMACKIIKEEQLNISCIDFGGGYFGGGDEGKAYKKYVLALHSTLKNYNCEKLKIIVEPGASLVATAISYLSTVIDTKNTTYGNFVTTDGTRLDIDPFMNKKSYMYDVVYQNNTIKQQQKQVICGYSCMENDRIMECNIPVLSAGDKIKYNIVGSYTMCFNSCFISCLPRVYSKKENGEFCIVREKWGINEFLQESWWKV